MDRSTSKSQELKSRRKLSLPGSSLVMSSRASLEEIDSSTEGKTDLETGDKVSSELKRDGNYIVHKEDDDVYPLDNSDVSNTNISHKAKDDR